jgi:hypothetical protein
MDQQIQDILYLDSLLYSQQQENLSVDQIVSSQDVGRREHNRNQNRRQGRRSPQEELEVGVEKEKDPIRRLTDKELIKICSQRGLISFEENEGKAKLVTETGTSKSTAGDDPVGEDDIAEEMILIKGKWDRRDLEKRLNEWLILSKRIQQGKAMTSSHLTSLVSHLIVLGSGQKA